MVNGSTDEQLIEQLQQGNTEALEALYDRYAKRLYVFCCSITRSQNAEDLVHDVFVQLIRSAHTYDPKKASLRTWLFRIARNRCLDAIRRSKRIHFVPIVEDSGSDVRTLGVPEAALLDRDASVEESVARSQLVRAVRDCIDELGGNQKQAIVLYYVSGKVYREIGEVLGRSTSMARKWVKSAQERVRQCLEGKGIHAPC